MEVSVSLFSIYKYRRNMNPVDFYPEIPWGFLDNYPYMSKNIMLLTKEIMKYL